MTSGRQWPWLLSFSHRSPQQDTCYQTVHDRDIKFCVFKTHSARDINIITLYTSFRGREMKKKLVSPVPFLLLLDTPKTNYKEFLYEPLPPSTPTRLLVEHFPTKNECPIEKVALFYVQPSQDPIRVRACLLGTHYG